MDAKRDSTLRSTDRQTTIYVERHRYSKTLKRASENGQEARKKEKGNIKPVLNKYNNRDDDEYYDTRYSTKGVHTMR